MLNTLVVLSCDMDGIVALPATPKMLLPLTIFAATRFASPLMVCAPVRYVPELMVWLVVVGVYVAAAFVVTEAVSDTALFPAVPLLTYPAETDGVTDTVLESVSVFVPVDTVADVPLMLAGAVALPLATLLLAALA